MWELFVVLFYSQAHVYELLFDISADWSFIQHDTSDLSFKTSSVSRIHTTPVSALNTAQSHMCLCC